MVGGAGADDGDLFEINSSGRLSFKDAPDYEMPADVGGNNQYNLTVKVTDSGSLSETLDVRVTISNVNEAPAITTDLTAFTDFAVDENTDTDHDHQDLPGNGRGRVHHAYLVAGRH